MMSFTAQDVKTLRERTGAGMMDCKNALVENDGDMEKAIDYLREKGIAKAAKKAGRIAAEGIVDSYIHGGGRVGVLLEVNCETDFVANGEMFRALVHDLALQIAAANPLYVSKEDVPAEALEREKAVLRAQALEEGKPEKIIDRMVEGRINTFYEDNCLLCQKFVKDPSKTIEQVVIEATAQIGEKIAVRRFVRYEMGEGLQKKEENLADEVQAQVNAMKK
ncbi:MAG: translation elongation factor Ts [Clostridia bacterium]|nr:translation elongation factor Ts [Clostridia bacterium]